RMHRNGARPVRAGGHWKRTCTSRHLASGLPVLRYARPGIAKPSRTSTDRPRTGDTNGTLAAGADGSGAAGTDGARTDGADAARVENTLVLRLSTNGDRLRVEVTDSGLTAMGPRIRTGPAFLLTEGGRGLAIVDLLSDGRWDVHTNPDGPGHTVWCEIATEPADTPAPCAIP
ncbi:ATP-binding protein, partial [Sphaerisporangium sp. NPDC051017]|uniref:ATP-binding protein n=1 Tax=Sphaerisporangium sp. NPDC051017 TaxID=3154636 RepID=UPI0034384937